MAKARILVVDDERGVRTFCTDLLTRAGHEVEAVDSGSAALELADQREFNIVLADINMPRMDGIELCRRLRAINPDQVVILITGFPSIDNAVQGMKEGARDYVTKPFTPDELRIVISRSLEEQQLRSDNERLRRALRSREGLDNIVGRSPAMKQLFEVARKVARSDTTVLIEGESGTGKELFARALHVHSPLATRPFVAINCGALPEQPARERALRAREGRLHRRPREQARTLRRGGRGDPLPRRDRRDAARDLQPKLLRVLQEGEVKPVGGVSTFKVNVRVVAATNRSLEQAVAAGIFREDLYYRINVFSLKIPPLRERREDIRRLVSHFLLSYSQKTNTPPKRISEAALALLEGKSWPGNVRELQNNVERALILSAGEVLDLEDFGEAPAFNPGTARPVEPCPPPGMIAAYPFEGMTLEEMERQHIEFTLSSVAGQKTRAAELLGINRTTLWKKLRHYDGD